ncbi:hypothetical protein HB771_33770 (plasmid) [Rhizobium leguminosarum bv. viciae]|nr:hypothetical protein HB771_33770 [Rhizobium leguminosarum bv. viciae]
MRRISCRLTRSTSSFGPRGFFLPATWFAGEASVALSMPEARNGGRGGRFFQPGDLVAQQLVLEFQAGILQPKGGVFLPQLDVVGLKLRKPGFCLLRPFQKTRHQSAQRIQ